MHWLKAWALLGLVVAFAVSRYGADANRVAELLGRLGPQLLLPTLLVSWLAQTGRSHWAWGVGLGLTACMISGFLAAVARQNSPAEIELEFTRGCSDRCRTRLAPDRCSVFCGCIWNGIRAHHPNDAELASSLRRSPANQGALQREVEGLGPGCMARSGGIPETPEFR